MFDYGDEVKIDSNAPSKVRPGEFGSICGFLTVQDEGYAEELSINKGEKVCLVEFGDGTSFDVPICFLGPPNENH